MVEFEGINSMTIEYSDLSNILLKKTGNILAEENIPSFLKKAVKGGITVYIE